MISTRESVLYISFFKENLLIILTAILLGLACAYIIQSSAPVQYHKRVLVELIFNEQTIREKVILADQWVSLLRSPIYLQSISLNRESSVKVYKPGPVTLDIDLFSSSSDITYLDESKIEKNLSENLAVKKIGAEEYIKRPSLPLFLSIGLLSGLLLGLVISFFKVYISKF